MGPVAADLVDGHEDTYEDAKGAEDQKREREGYLLHRWPVVNDVGCLQYVVVANGERLVDIRHRRQPEKLQRPLGC